GCDLMRVLAVAHVLRLDELSGEGARQLGAVLGGQRLRSLIDGAQVVGDHAVIGGGVLEGLQCQVETLGIGQAAIAQVVENVCIVTGVDHDGNVLVVLGRAANHGRAPDIDVLDGIRQGAARLGDGGRKGVKVDCHQIDRVDPVFGHDCTVQVATAEDAAVNLRVQGLDATIHHFRKAGVVGHFDGGNSVLAQQLEGAAG